MSIWEKVSFVNRSKNRKDVLTGLSGPTTPTVLAKRLDLYRSVVSRALIALEKEGLVACLNPQSKKERYYNLTRLGEKVKKNIGRIES